MIENVLFPGAFFILDPSELGEVSAGLWGYSAVLTFAGFACIFYPLSPRSALLATAAVGATGALQATLRITMAQQVQLLIPYYSRGE